MNRVGSKQAGDGAPVRAAWRARGGGDLQQSAAYSRDQKPGTDRVAKSSSNERLRLALEIDRAMRQHAPAGRKGDEVRKAEVRITLFPLLDRDHEATQALF